MIDTSRWLRGENRVVFMSPVNPPENSPPSVVENNSEPAAVEKSAEELKQEAINAKKTSLSTKVESAKGVVANLKALYGENEQGVDTNTDNDSGVKKLCDDLSAKLNGMDSAFTTEAEKITSEYETQLDALETKLVTEVLAVKEGGTATEIEAGIKEDVATVAGKDVATVTTDLKAFEAARDADKKAVDDAQAMVTEYEEFITDYIKLNPNKAQAFAELGALIANFKTNPEYAKKGGDIDSAALTKATEALNKAFTEKVQALTAKPYDQLKAETFKISESELQVGRDILTARKDSQASFNGGDRLGAARLNSLAITDAENFKIKSYIEQPAGSPFAVEVMNYEGVSFKQEFTDQAAFARLYPGITLPEKGKTATVTEEKWLSKSMPSPFGGLRRERSLTISVDKTSGKITVDVSNIKFGEPPANSEVRISLRKPIDQVRSVRDVLYPNSDYKPGSGADGAASDSASESGETKEASLAKLREYQKADFSKLDAIKQLTDTLPVYLQERFGACRELHAKIGDFLAGGKSDAELAGFTKEISRYQPLLMTLAKSGPLTEQDLIQIPELREYYDLMNKDKGLNYGEGANERGRYDIGQFKGHFRDAGNLFDNTFLDTVNGGRRVNLVGVHMVFGLEQNSQRYVSGTFTLKVNGYEGEDSITFPFSKVGGGTWEEAVTNAMKDLVKDSTRRRGDTFDAINKQEKGKEHMEWVRRDVDDREKENLADRIRSIERHGTEDYSAFDDPDYKADSKAKIEADIKKDFGNINEYDYKEVKPGKWAAVRLCERGTVPPAADEKFGKAVNNPEDILTAHEKGEVDERELKNLAKRKEGKQKDPNYKPTSDPDYTAANRDDVVSAITADHGNPAEYDIRSVDSGEYVAIRKCQRDTPGGEAQGEFGVAAGLIEYRVSALSESEIDQLREDCHIDVTVVDGKVTKIDTARVYSQTIDGDGFRSVGQAAELPLAGKEIRYVITNPDGVAIFHLIDSNTKKEQIYIFSTEPAMPAGYTASNFEEQGRASEPDALNYNDGDDEIIAEDLGATADTRISAESADKARELGE